MSLSPLPAPSNPTHDELMSMRPQWGLFLFLGVMSILIGMMAIGSSFIATLLSVKLFGWLLVIAGMTEVVHAVMGSKCKNFALHLLSAVLYLLVGLFILRDPLRAAAVLTLLLTTSFIVGGILRIIFSFSVRFHAWQWVALNGVVDLLLGIFLWNEWPESSLWVIGLFMGIDLLFHGWSWVILALGVRSYNPPPQTA